MNNGLFLLSIPIQDEESLATPTLECRVGATSWSWSINPNRKGNKLLLPLWTFSVRQTPLPGPLISPVRRTVWSFLLFPQKQSQSSMFFLLITNDRIAILVTLKSQVYNLSNYMDYWPCFWVKYKNDDPSSRDGLSQ